MGPHAGQDDVLERGRVRDQAPPLHVSEEVEGPLPGPLPGAGREDRVIHAHGERGAPLAYPPEEPQRRALVPALGLDVARGLGRATGLRDRLEGRLVHGRVGLAAAPPPLLYLALQLLCAPPASSSGCAARSAAPALAALLHSLRLPEDAGHDTAGHSQAATSPAPPLRALRRRLLRDGAAQGQAQPRQAQQPDDAGAGLEARERLPASSPLAVRRTAGDART
mmetsp:Transcript_99319/g.289836  ORF Transcript_99319/g.289836 Transcript_99319/m.289836 type:complete len:223 (-) Transcript_99319:180-848(-)